MPEASGRKNRFLYIFLDEAGNFDFSENGTRYFQVGAITKERPFHACKALNELKYDLVERGLDVEYFHAAEDQQATRNEVLGIIAANLDGVRYDSVYVEKARVEPGGRAERYFYPALLGRLILHLVEAHRTQTYTEVIVFTDRIPVNRKRASVEKAVKQTLSRNLPAGTRYRVFHHDSKSNFDLQIADYFNWATYRRLRSGDERAYRVIAGSVANEIDYLG